MVWIWSRRGSTCLIPMEGGMGCCWKLSLSLGIEERPRWVRSLSCWVSWLLHPSCPDWKGRRAGSTASNAGKEIKEVEDSHTTYKQVNKCFRNAYVSLKIKITKSKLFSATCWKLCHELDVVLCVGVFILIKLFWNLILFFILSRSHPLNIGPGETKLNNKQNNRNSFSPNCRH